MRVLATLAGMLGLTLVLAPSVAAGDPCYHGYTIPPATTAATSAVQLDPCAFLPTNAEVAPGTTVTFTNNSGFAHLLMGANAGWGERDKEIPDGGSVSVRFDKPGIYAYACALHRGMSGAIVVGDPNAASAGAASTSVSSGGGLTTAVGFAVLAALAAVGWGLALLQRRSPRLATASAER